MEPLQLRMKEYLEKLRLSLNRAQVLGFLSIRWWLFLLLAVIVTLHVYPLFLRFPPFATKGAIYVDSPEVYTRERLVNDRYDQDHWLRRQLQNIDSSENLITSLRFENRKFLVGDVTEQQNGASNDANPANNEQPGWQHPGLTIEQVFRIRSGLRDAIRQQILENMLDDRHDLSGNSVYALKFDTTVIPGTNTHQRAFVRVALFPDHPFSQGVTSHELQQHVVKYFASDLSEIQNDPSNDLYEPFRLYTKWLENVEFRLNNHISRIFELKKKDACLPENIEPNIWNALETVLGMDQRRFVRGVDNSNKTRNKVPIAKSWANFLQIETTAASSCPGRPWFYVKEVVDHLYLFSNQKDKLPAWARHQYRIIRRTADRGTNITVFNPYGNELTPDQNESIKPHYTVTDSLVAHIRDSNKVLEYCVDYPRPESLTDCERPLSLSRVPSGFFNFMEKVFRTDQYYYAIFPKNDLLGSITESTLSSAVKQSIRQDNGNSGISLEALRHLIESTTTSTLVGFGDATNLTKGKVEFGWVVSGHDRLGPVQKAQMALVSVPAWTSDLKAEIATGWLDRNAREEVSNTVTFSIPLPPDYEAFDSFIGGSQVRREPKILNDFLDTITVDACRRAEILIPGFRLWRSTSVTLGSQKAVRITVLPNMRGIIATFDPVEIPTSTSVNKACFEPGSSACADTKDQQIKEVMLRVWTSEGETAADKSVKVRVPDNGECPVQKG